MLCCGGGDGDGIVGELGAAGEVFGGWKMGGGGEEVVWVTVESWAPRRQGRRKTGGRMKG